MVSNIYICLHICPNIDIEWFVSAWGGTALNLFLPMGTPNQIIQFDTKSSHKRFQIAQVVVRAGKLREFGATWFGLDGALWRR